MQRLTMQRAAKEANENFMQMKSLNSEFSLINVHDC